MRHKPRIEIGVFQLRTCIFFCFPLTCAIYFSGSFICSQVFKGATVLQSYFWNFSLSSIMPLFSNKWSPIILCLPHASFSSLKHTKLMSSCVHLSGILTLVRSMSHLQSCLYHPASSVPLLGCRVFSPHRENGNGLGGQLWSCTCRATLGQLLGLSGFSFLIRNRTIVLPLVGLL